MTKLTEQYAEWLSEQQSSGNNIERKATAHFGKEFVDAMKKSKGARNTKFHERGDRLANAAHYYSDAHDETEDSIKGLRDRHVAALASAYAAARYLS